MAGLTGEVANLIVALKLDDRGFSGKLNGISRQLRGMDAGFSQMGRGAGQLGSGLARLGTLAATAAAGGLTAVITTAASFEQAFTGVEKTVDGTEAQLGELEDTIRGMARNMPIAFEELAAIGESGGALGVARESLDEFIDVVARLSVSTNLSSDEAATALGQLGTILDLTGQDYEDFADTLVALGNAGASTEDQIVQMAARFAAAGNSAGLTNDEILTLSSAVASMGVEVEAGGSSLSRLFNNTTTNIGVANDKAKDFAEALGLTFDQFKEAWRTDALGTFEDLLGKLNELDQFEGAALLKSIGITNTRDVNTILLMAQNMDFLAEQTAVAKDAQGALREESDKFFDTAQGQWKTFINIVRDSAAIIGEELLPVTKDVLAELSAALDNPETRQKLRDFAKDLAQGVRDLVEAVKGTDFSALIGTMKGAAEVAKGAFAAFNALPEPVKQLAIAALVANKVTGGAVSSIASGLGNILMGGLKLAIPALSRGTTPANPMFVKEVGLGGAGGLGGAAGGKGGKGGLLGAAGTIIGGLTAAAVAKEIDDAVADNFGLEDNELSWPWGPKNTPTILPELFGGNGLLGGTNNAGFAGQVPSAPGGGGATLRPNDAADADRALLAQWGGKLDKLATNEVIEHLRRTNEIGLEGVGTSFQTGLTNGLDPIGDAATQILARAENPKDPAVMREIEGHIAGLEEIQRTYLDRGDVSLAAKVQTNIDTLHDLIGTTDTQNAITDRLAADARGADMAQRTRLDVLAQKQDVTNGKLGVIAGKNFSPILKNEITIPVTTTINANVLSAAVSTVVTTSNPTPTSPLVL